MSHRFDPSHKQVLDDPERKIWQDPAVLIEWLSLKGDETIVDIGAGTGFFAIPFAGYSPGITLYAVDVSSEMLDSIKEKQEKLGVENIVILLTDGKTLPVDKDSADLIIAADVFHELVDNAIVFQEIRDTLNDDGRFVVVDWKKKDTGFGPPVHARKTEEEVVTILAGAGFSLTRRAELYANHYTLEFAKTLS